MIQGKWIPPGKPFEEALRLREEVFVEEQGFSRALERDALDDWSWHVILYQEDRPAATGRIYYQDGAYWLGRICVRKAARGLGLGDLLMRMLLFKAREHHAPVVRLGAQESAAGFYAKYGFAPYGEPYDEEGVPHIHMELAGSAIDLSGTCARAGAEGCAGCPSACDDAHHRHDPEAQ